METRDGQAQPSGEDIPQDGPARQSDNASARPEQSAQRPEGIARRGALAGLAALVAGGLAKASERVAWAAGNGSPLTMGNNNGTTKRGARGEHSVHGRRGLRTD